jgi:hypothetical protein
MEGLRENFETLLRFAKEHNFSQPFSQVYFVEQREIEFFSNSKSHKIPRKSLSTFESYENRFDELFNQGHSWINMYLAGVLNDFLLVIIETPDYENCVPREFVSIKFSLPEKRVAENNWKLEMFYKIID